MVARRRMSSGRGVSGARGTGGLGRDPANMWARLLFWTGSRWWGEIPCRARHGWAGGSVGSGVGSPCGVRGPPVCGKGWEEEPVRGGHVAPVGCEKKWYGARSNDVIDKELTSKI